MQHRDLTSPIPWRRSLRASQERRAGARRRALRERLSRRGLAAALAGLAVMAGGAVAHTGGSDARSSSDRGKVSRSVLERGDRGKDVRALQRALRIGVDGIYGRKTVSAVKRFQRREDLAVDGVAGPKTLRALGLRRGRSSSKQRRSSSTRSSSMTAHLERIARCESGGNPRAVSASGRYRGKYQFSRATWRAVGGEGDPAKASEREQDRRARILYKRQGPSSAWPSCA